MIANFQRSQPSRWQMLAAVPLFLLGLVFLTDARTRPMEVSGLMGSWSAEGNARDAISGHDGVLKGKVAFSQGVRGQAFD
jgi:hypothetical protein